GLDRDRSEREGHGHDETDVHRRAQPQHDAEREERDQGELGGDEPRMRFHRASLRRRDVGQRDAEHRTDQGAYIDRPERGGEGVRPRLWTPTAWAWTFQRVFASARTPTTAVISGMAPSTYAPNPYSASALPKSSRYTASSACSANTGPIRW